MRKEIINNPNIKKKERKENIKEMEELTTELSDCKKYIFGVDARVIKLKQARANWIAEQQLIKEYDAKISKNHSYNFEQEEKAREDYDLMLLKMFNISVPSIDEYPNSFPIEELKEGKHLIITQEWVEMKDKKWAQLVICDDGKSYYITRPEDVSNNTYACESGKFIISKTTDGKITIIPVSSLEQNPYIKIGDILKPDYKLYTECKNDYFDIDTLGCVDKIWYARIYGKSYNLVELLDIGETIPFDEKNVVKINSISAKISKNRKGYYTLSNIQFIYDGVMHRFNIKSRLTKGCRLVALEDGSAFTSLKLV